VKNIWQWYYYSTSLTLLPCLERYLFKESLVTSEQNLRDKLQFKETATNLEVNMTYTSDFYLENSFPSIIIHQIDSIFKHKNLVYV